jgi:quinol monooxygenase YgiN
MHRTMKRFALAVGAAILATGVAAVSTSDAKSEAAPTQTEPMVRIAVLEIDPAQLDAYKAILREEQEASVRLEPGVLMLHSVQFADNPSQIRLLEVYASRAAYEAHIKSPHFIKYKISTEKMVKTLELVPTTPILLCAKSKGRAGGPVTCM